MKYNKKLQEGVFIGVFALATLVVISLAIGFLSNRVNDLLNNQGQMIAGKQAYWLANSGVEVIAQDKLADLGSASIPVKLAEIPDDYPDGVDIGVTYDKYYSFAGGSIQIVGDNPAGVGYHNGLARTEIVTIIGTDANSAHQIKWTLGSPDHRAYNFTFSEATTPLTYTVTELRSGSAPLVMTMCCQEPVPTVKPCDKDCSVPSPLIAMLLASVKRIQSSSASVTPNNGFSSIASI